MGATRIWGTFEDGNLVILQGFKFLYFNIEDVFLKIIISFNKQRQTPAGHLVVIKAGIYSAVVARCPDNQQPASIDQVLPCSMKQVQIIFSHTWKSGHGEVRQLI